MEKHLTHIDNLFKEGLGSYSETPPPSVWDALEERLDKDDKKKPGFFLRRWFFVTLAIVGVIGTLMAWKRDGDATTIFNNAAASANTNNAEAATHTAIANENISSIGGSAHQLTATQSGNTRNNVHLKHKSNHNSPNQSLTNEKSTYNNKQENLASAADRVKGENKPVETTAKNTTGNNGLEGLMASADVTAPAQDVPHEATKQQVIKYIVKNSIKNNIEVAETTPVTETIINGPGSTISEPGDEDDVTFGKPSGASAFTSPSRNTATINSNFHKPTTYAAPSSNGRKIEKNSLKTQAVAQRKQARHSRQTLAIAGTAELANVDKKHSFNSRTKVNSNSRSENKTANVELASVNDSKHGEKPSSTNRKQSERLLASNSGVSKSTIDKATSLNAAHGNKLEQRSTKVTATTITPNKINITEKTEKVNRTSTSAIVNNSGSKVGTGAEALAKTSVIPKEKVAENAKVNATKRVAQATTVSAHENAAETKEKTALAQGERKHNRRVVHTVTVAQNQATGTTSVSGKSKLNNEVAIASSNPKSNAVAKHNKVKVNGASKAATGDKINGDIATATTNATTRNKTVSAANATNTLAATEVSKQQIDAKKSVKKSKGGNAVLAAASDVTISKKSTARTTTSATKSTPSKDKGLNSLALAASASGQQASTHKIKGVTKTSGKVTAADASKTSEINTAAKTKSATKQTISNSKSEIAEADDAAEDKQTKTLKAAKKKKTSKPTPQSTATTIAAAAKTNSTTTPLAAATATTTSATKSAGTAPLVPAAAPTKPVAPAKNDSAAKSLAKNATDSAANKTAKVDSPNTDQPKVKKHTLEYGMKAGYELGFADGAAKKMVLSPFVEYSLTDKLSVMTQPAYKTSFINNRDLSGTQTLVKPGQASVTYEGSFAVVINTGGITTGYTVIRNNFLYQQNYNTVVKSYSIGGNYSELELPILLKYKLTKQLSVYGGLNLDYSKYVAIHENSKTGPTFIKDSAYANLNYPGSSMPTPPSAASIFQKMNSAYTNYPAPLYPAQNGSAIRLGYMLGFSYEYKKRYLIDVLMQQTTGKQNMLGGMNINQSLSSNYFRFTLGYKLSK